MTATVQSSLTQQEQQQFDHFRPRELQTMFGLIELDSPHVTSSAYYHRTPGGSRRSSLNGLQMTSSLHSLLSAQ